MVILTFALQEIQELILNYGGAGRGSFNSLSIEFDHGNATTISNVKIVWSSGVTENFSSINIEIIF
jgi:hypothetical protein